MGGWRGNRRWGIEGMREDERLRAEEGIEGEGEREWKVENAGER